ncbi:MAG: thiol peroxidase [Verrucomicrobiota bacterium]
MATITFKGNPVNTAGDLPAVGSAAPDFNLTATDLSGKSLADYAGKTKILSINPSLDTGVCAMSAKAFNEKVGGNDNLVVLNISADLPFAAGRFCGAEELSHIEALSVFRSAGFGTDYGILMTDGPLEGLLGRAIVVVDGDNNVAYTELVPEITQEPDYDAALAAAQG